MVIKCEGDDELKVVEEGAREERWGNREKEKGKEDRKERRGREEKEEGRVTRKREES